MRQAFLCWLLFALTCGSASSQESAEPIGSEPPPGNGSITNEIQDRFAGYLDTFNTNDAEAVGAYWSEEAVSVDQETGERSRGREAIVAGFKELFTTSSGVRLTGQVNEVRRLDSDVTIAEGIVTLSTAESEPTRSAFTAVLVKQGGKWLLESSYERALPNPTSHDALKELEWLVGDWRDQTDQAEVLTTVRWSPSEAFLIRSYRADYGEEEAFEGTQIFGWDPHEKQYRTWVFNSDGSFGEGILSRSSNQWLIRMSYKRSDGTVAAGTQILEPLDAETMRVERIGQTIDGVPVLAGEPVTVVRAGAEQRDSQEGGAP